MSGQYSPYTTHNLGFVKNGRNYYLTCDSFEKESDNEHTIRNSIKKFQILDLMIKELEHKTHSK